jgi:hypothetical protein
VDASAAEFDEEEHIEPLQRDRLDREEVDRDGDAEGVQFARDPLESSCRSATISSSLNASERRRSSTSWCRQRHAK